MSGRTRGRTKQYDRKVATAVGDHLNGGCGEVSQREQERLYRIVMDGLEVSCVVESLEALGSGRIIGVQQGMGRRESEFEGLVVCMFQTGGMTTEKLMELGSGRSTCM